MAQVSGSISLDLSKVVRETTHTVIQEMTRTVPTRDEEEQGLSVPLATLADAVTERVAQLTSADLLRIERKVDALAELIRAEAERRDRLTNGPVTGEFPVITPEDLTEEYRPENDPTRPGMTPVGRMIPDPADHDAIRHSG